MSQKKVRACNRIKTREICTSVLAYNGAASLELCSLFFKYYSSIEPIIVTSQIIKRIWNKKVENSSRYIEQNVKAYSIAYSTAKFFSVLFISIEMLPFHFTDTLKGESLIYISIEL